MSKSMFRLYSREVGTKKYLLLAAFVNYDHALSFFSANELMDYEYKIVQGKKTMFKVEREEITI